MGSDQVLLDVQRGAGTTPSETISNNTKRENTPTSIDAEKAFNKIQTHSQYHTEWARTGSIPFENWH